MGRPYTTYDEYPKRIAEWLKRANAWWRYDEVTNTLNIFSRNEERPLTNHEKLEIAKYLVMRKHAYARVHFGGIKKD